MKAIAVAAVLAAFSTAAMAADVVEPQGGGLYYDKPAMWTGFYVGVHAGYGWSGQDIALAHPCCKTLGGEPTFSGNVGHDSEAFVGGLQVGADHQIGVLVLGVVIDGSLGNFESSSVTRMDYDTDWAMQSSIEGFGSARARLGFTTGNLMLYATGGVAFAQVETAMQTISITGPVTMSELSDDSWHVGYVIGAGAEWQFAPGWSFGLEALHYDFGSADYDPKGLAYAGTAKEFQHHELAKGELEMNVIRGTLNKRF